MLKIKVEFVKKVIILVASVLIIACESSTKSKDDKFESLTQLVDQYAESTLSQGNISTIALGIYKDGKTYHKYYGSANGDLEHVPNDASEFEIASVTKVFVGSLIAKAVLEKRITLEDDIRNYLKGDYENLEYQGTPITIKNLLTHTLGFKNRKPEQLEKIEDQISNGYYENKPITYTMNDFLEDLKTVELDKKPGTFYEYNSVGSELLAYILEQVYDDSFQNVLNDFLNALDMKNTYLQNSRKEHSNRVVVGFDENGKKAPKGKSALLGGGGGLISTLPDLMRFLKFQLESKDPLIKESTRKLFENDDDDILGYLWDVDVADEEGFYYLKTGTSYGTQSVVLVCPDTNYGLILITNNTSDSAINDWGNLYNKVESDLIKYPRLNLPALWRSEIINNAATTVKKYTDLSSDTETYYSNPTELNEIASSLIKKGQLSDAIDVLKLLVANLPNHYYAYDRLAEAYFKNTNYEKALINYNKSLELYPDNTNAKNRIEEINKRLADH